MSEELPPLDPGIDLKKRARRRLVGAVALALLAIIVLPLVMDSEPKQAGQDIQIRIPSQEAEPSVGRLIPSHPAEPSPSPVANSATVGSEAAPAGSLPLKSSIEKSVEIPAPAVDKVSDEKKRMGAGAVPPALPSKSPDVAKAVAALEGKESEQWILQLGAYQNAANVKQLVSKLKAMGLAAYTESFESPQGPRTRVRAGPFKSHDDAEKARLRVKKIGVDGSVAVKQ
jgi:DedD protein